MPEKGSHIKPGVVEKLGHSIASEIHGAGELFKDGLRNIESKSGSVTNEIGEKRQDRQHQHQQRQQQEREPKAKECPDLNAVANCEYGYEGNINQRPKFSREHIRGNLNADADLATISSPTHGAESTWSAPVDVSPTQSSSSNESRHSGPELGQTPASQNAQDTEEKHNVFNVPPFSFSMPFSNPPGLKTRNFFKKLIERKSTLEDEKQRLYEQKHCQDIDEDKLDDRTVACPSCMDSSSTDTDATTPISTEDTGPQQHPRRQGSISSRRTATFNEPVRAYNADNEEALTSPPQAAKPSSSRASSLNITDDDDDELFIRNVPSHYNSKDYEKYHTYDDDRLRAIRESIVSQLPHFNLLGDRNKKIMENTDAPKDVLLESEKIRLDDFVGDIVVMGGYRGSILRDSKTHKQLWLPLKAGFKLRKVELRVPFDDYSEEHAEDKIYPDGMLSRVGPVDVSRSLLNRLREVPGCRVHDFGYDWRLSGQYCSKKLVQFLKTLKCNDEQYLKDHPNEIRGAIVIAHSMGGLVSHAAMQQDTSLFRSLIYVGTPHSSPTILGPLKFGDSVLFSDSILTPLVNFSMRSSFLFLPLDGMCFYDKKTGEPIPIDFYDPKTWVKYKLSPVIGAVESGSEGHPFSTKFHLNLGPLNLRPYNINQAKHNPPKEQVQQNSEPHSRQDPNARSSLSEDSSGNSSIFQKLSIFGNNNSDTASEGTAHSNDDRASLSDFQQGSSSERGESTANLASSSSESAKADVWKTSDSQESKPGNGKFSYSQNQAIEYLSRTLGKTQEFLESLNYIDGKKYPPLAIVYSNTTPTAIGSWTDGAENIVNSKFNDLVFGPGDGVVSSQRLMPPQDFPLVAKVKSDHGHVTLLDDLPVIEKALQMVLHAEQHEIAHAERHRRARAKMLAKKSRAERLAREGSAEGSPTDEGQHVMRPRPERKQKSDYHQ